MFILQSDLERPNPNYSNPSMIADKTAILFRTLSGALFMVVAREEARESSCDGLQLAVVQLDGPLLTDREKFQ